MLGGGGDGERHGQAVGLGGGDRGPGGRDGGVVGQRARNGLAGGGRILFIIITVHVSAHCNVQRAVGIFGIKNQKLHIVYTCMLHKPV